MRHDDDKNREEWLQEEEIKNEIFIQQMKELAERLKCQKMNYMINPKAVQAIDGLEKFFEEKSKRHMDEFKNTPYDVYPFVFQKNAIPLVHPSMCSSHSIVIRTKDEEGFSFKKSELETIYKIGNGLIGDISVHAVTSPDGVPLGETRLSIQISDFFILIPNTSF